ncbi:hypothetical protein BaRGS_00008251 [Batillaria attramentaria]|uniref:Uncharacterized protein n=1 Tax=Batillaria attramentaria TaxID=370345 RepID=A0ABD0LLB3_9CAEN
MAWRGRGPLQYKTNLSLDVDLVFCSPQHLHGCSISSLGRREGVDGKKGSILQQTGVYSFLQSGYPRPAGRIAGSLRTQGGRAPIWELQSACMGPVIAEPNYINY